MSKPFERRARRYLPPSLQRADLWSFRAVARWHTPVLDKSLPRLSRAADHSLLWLGIAALLGASRRRDGRRAALRGLLSVAITSAVANVPAKLLVRRRRPDASGVPLVRRLRRVPTSTSFPSGHSASAAAFATGVAMEMPAAGVPVGVLAGGVALSRVYTGVHYPGDVLAGVALGAGVALASRRLWPTVSVDAADMRPSIRAGRVDPDPDGKGLVIVVNAASGPERRESPAEQILAALPAATVVEVEDGADIASTVARVIEGARAIAIAGGDGSINAVAEIAVRARKPVAVIPAGTLNHFARDLGIDSLDDAVAAIKGGDIAEVDVGLIDGRPFLNTASFGVYAQMVDERERLEGKIGKWPALIVAFSKIMRANDPIEVEIDGKRLSLRMIFIGNGRYVPRGFAPNRRERLDDGSFDVRIVKAGVRWAVPRLLVALAAGRLNHSRTYEEWTVSTLKVRSANGPLRLARDGETFDGSEAFTIEKATEPLLVFARPRT